MASLRDIKRKIRVVKNISQITQAMKMVAAARLRRVQERVEKGKPYAETMTNLVGVLAPNVTEISHPLLDNRPTGAVGIVVIAADKGLCGSYNTNILRTAHQFIDRKMREMNEGEAPGLRNGRDAITLVTVGRKATDYFTKRGYRVSQSFAAPSPQGPYDEIRAISEAITGMFLRGEVDEVHIAYTEFKSVISQRPTVVKFLPIEPPSAEEEAAAEAKQATMEFIFEPDAPQLLAVLLPRFVETRVYQLLMEAVASEFGARMTAMTNATKNAGEQIEALTLLANRTRQAGITKELLDIVGGAEALKG
jgi:F-type H+-transporting ATPase subunit gamma